MQVERKHRVQLQCSRTFRAGVSQMLRSAQHERKSAKCSVNAMVHSSSSFTFGIVYGRRGFPLLGNIQVYTSQAPPMSSHTVPSHFLTLSFYSSLPCLCPPLVSLAYLPRVSAKTKPTCRTTWLEMFPIRLRTVGTVQSWLEGYARR